MMVLFIYIRFFVWSFVLQKNVPQCFYVSLPYISIGGRVGLLSPLNLANRVPISVIFEKDVFLHVSKTNTPPPKIFANFENTLR